MADTLVTTLILFFGRLGEQLGRERAITLADATTIGALRRRLAAEDDALALLAGDGVRASIDQQVVTDDATVRPGQEVAFFSPLSGG